MQLQPEQRRLLWVAGLLGPGAMILVGLLIAWLGTGRLPDLGHLPSWQVVQVGLLTSAASMGLIYLLSKLSRPFEQALRESGTKVGEEALRMAGYPLMLLVVTMAGLGEEILFRGGLQPLVGLPLAAFLFGFSHGGWRRENWAYVVAATLSGLLFGGVYLWTGDLWASIIGHCGHNLLSTLFIGKRFEVRWRGWWPVVRLLPEEAEDEAAVPGAEEQPNVEPSPQALPTLVGQAVETVPRRRGRRGLRPRNQCELRRFLRQRRHLTPQLGSGRRRRGRRGRRRSR